MLLSFLNMPQTKERLRTHSATLLSFNELAQLRRSTPPSWKKAAGLMRHKRKSLERHIAAVGNEWDRRTR